MSERTADIQKELITRRELAAMTSMSLPWLDKIEREGRGCPRVKLGRSVRYRMSDVREFLARLTATS